MDYRPSHAHHEAREILRDQLTDAATLAQQVIDTGSDLSAAQRQAIERLIGAARDAIEQMEGGR